MDQQFSTVLQRSDKSDGRARMVGACRVNDGVGCLRGPHQNFRIVKRSGNRDDSTILEQLSLLPGPRQASYLMAGRYKLLGDRAADIAGRTGDEDFHVTSPRFIARTDIATSD